MARNRFPVEILTPEGEVFNDEVEMISTRTATGSIGVLANHAPLLAMLDPTELRLYRGEGQVLSFAQGEGYMQVGGNRALILVEDATPPEHLDRAQLEERLRKAERDLEGAKPETEAHRKAARAKRRCEAFLRVAERA